MNREGIENQFEQLNKEADFQKALKSVFSTKEGLRVFEYILNLGGFGGIPQGDFDCGRHAISSQVWIDVMKAAPDVAKAFIDLRHTEVINDRQYQFKQLENQLKEVDDE